MLMKQISIFIENRPGRLSEVVGAISDAGINIHALSLADTTDFGIMRLIVSDPDKAIDALRDSGLTVKTTEVVIVSLEHAPGSLARVLSEMTNLGISIEYMYAFTSRTKEHDALVIFRLSNQEEVVDKITGSWIKTLGAELLDELNKN